MGHDYGAAARLPKSSSWDEQLAFEKIWCPSCAYLYLANAAPGGVDGVYSRNVYIRNVYSSYVYSSYVYSSYVYSSNSTCKTAGTAHSQTNRETAINSMNLHRYDKL